MSFLISNALADTASTAVTGPAGGAGSLFMLVGFLVIFYFLLWRPQAKRAKEHNNLVANLKPGDEVTTSGGLVGKINKINDDFIILTVADNINITLQKTAVSSVLPKGTLKAS